MLSGRSSSWGVLYRRIQLPRLYESVGEFILSQLFMRLPSIESEFLPISTRIHRPKHFANRIVELSRSQC